MRRPKPLRALGRALDRMLLGPIMTIGAFIIERRVIKSIKNKPANASGSDPTQAQG